MLCMIILNTTTNNNNNSIIIILKTTFFLEEFKPVREKESTLFIIRCLPRSPYLVW